jgi:hypothetical protein
MTSRLQVMKFGGTSAMLLASRGRHRLSPMQQSRADASQLHLGHCGRCPSRFVRSGKYRDVILPMMVLRRLDAILEPTKKSPIRLQRSSGVPEDEPEGDAP